MTDNSAAWERWFFEQKDVFSQVVDAIADMVLVKGENSRILWANRAFRDYYGMSNEELRHRIDAPFNEVDFTSQYVRDDLQVFTSGEILDIPEEPVTRHDGVIQIFHTVKSPIRDPHGSICATVGVARNITGQKRNQDELERYRQHLERLVGERTSQIKGLSDRLQIVLSSLVEGIVALDGAGRVRLLNPAAETLTGWTTDDAKGHELSQLLNFEAEQPGLSLPAMLSASRQISGHLRAREGRVHLVSIKGSPLVGQSEEFLGSVVVIRDIGAEREVEDQRLNNQKLESVGLLAGGIAHDFNNIVTGILSSISLARLGLQRGDDIADLLNEAEQACLRTKGLTTQLLTFAKGGAPVKKVICVENLLREASEFALRGSSVELDFHCPPQVWPVEADEGQLAQVMHNLFLNAKQAMPGGGKLSVSVENLGLAEGNALPVAAGPYLLISVKDTGPGILAHHLTRVFDPYFTTRDAGTGLGLASVHSILRRHGGHVTVTSRPGDGACFRVYLPATPNGDPCISVKPTVHVASVRPRKLLVLDDDHGVLGAMRAMLQHLGHRVVLAERSSAAFLAFDNALVAGQPFDAVLVDLTMPGDLGGVEVATWLREKDPTVRIVVMSGYSVDPVMADPEARGFCAALPKPFTVEVLNRAVESCFAVLPTTRALSPKP